MDGRAVLGPWDSASIEPQESVSTESRDPVSGRSRRTPGLRVNKMARQRILIIGAGKWHVPLFRGARELGLEVVATHVTAADAPGFEFSDHTYVLDARDKAGTLEVARRHDVRGVLTAADLAVPTVAHVAQVLGLPGISTEAARAATNKAEMRRRARDLGLAVPRFFAVREEEEGRARAGSVGYPCVVKPTDSWGSRGVTVVIEPDQFATAWREALRYSFDKEILVEEFLRGTESSVEGFVDGEGRFHVLGICDKKKSELPYRFDLELHYPGRFSEAQLAAIEAFVAALVEGFGITMGLTHTELMVSGEKVWLIETAARGCGAFVVSKLLPAMTGLPIVELVIRQAMGERIEIAGLERRHGLLKFIMLSPGLVRAATGIAEARAVPGIVDLDLEVAPGATVAPATNTQGRSGHLLAVGSSRAEADAVAEKALRHLRIEVAS